MPILLFLIFLYPIVNNVHRINLFYLNGLLNFIKYHVHGLEGTLDDDKLLIHLYQSI